MQNLLRRGVAFGGVVQVRLKCKRARAMVNDLMPRGVIGALHIAIRKVIRFPVRVLALFNGARLCVHQLRRVSVQMG